MPRIVSIPLMQTLALWAVPVLLAITVHEVAHGWVAWQHGDPTALEAGRLTLNPLPHIDWFGTVLLPLLLISTVGLAAGWARPVPVNARRLRQPHRDMGRVAIAGPAANLLMLLAWGLVARVGFELGSASIFGTILFGMGQAGIVINALLMLLNLIPIPPLDGSVVLASFLSPEWSRRFLALGRYTLFLALGLLVLGFYTGWLQPLLIRIMDFLFRLFGLFGG